MTWTEDPSSGKREGAVGREIIRLVQAIQQLTMEVAQIDTRTAAVRGASPPVIAKEAERQPQELHCPISKDLFELRERIETLSRALKEINAQLEI